MDRDALRLLPPPGDQLLGREVERDFPIPFQQTSINRSDLRMFFEEKEVALFSDEDLAQLALMLASAYVGSGIMWEDLKLFALQLLEHKRSK